MRHAKKAWPSYFQKVLEGKKKVDLRLADWECEEGDVLILREWNPETKRYSGREIEKTIASVIKTKDLKFWPEEEVKKYGYQVISFE